MLFGGNKPRVAVIRAAGTIAAMSRGRGKVNVAKLEKPLQRAFKMRNVRAVALVINSPGGSPTQSNLIMKRMNQLKKQHNVPVYAFVEDVAASGGYYLACGADKIYADENSIVGSIGVISHSFGLDKWIKRYDIERRTHTAGKRKAMLDPFVPEDKADVKDLQELLTKLHGNFQDVVKQSRGDRLKLDTPDLFEGKIWLAKDAQDIGLIDGIGDMHSVMRDVLGEEPKLVEFTKHSPWEDMFGGMSANADTIMGRVASLFSAQSGGTAANVSEAMTGALAAVEEEAAWRSVGVTHR